MISIKKILFCLLLAVACLPASAQLYSKLAQECYKMYNVFTDTGYLSYTIKYYYSTEKKPATYTDSVITSMKMHQGNYYGKFKTTEYMQNSQYLLSIYSANTAIMVSNPVIRNATVMPLAKFDSAFLAREIDSAWITETGNVRAIKFRFTDSSAFKNYTINYDKTSYQLQAITYSLKQKYFNKADTAYLPANPLITILFTGYSKTKFSDTLFDHTKYIQKDTAAGQFKGVGKYSSFEILSTYQVPDTAGPLPDTGIGIIINSFKYMNDGRNQLAKYKINTIVTNAGDGSTYAIACEEQRCCIPQNMMGLKKQRPSGTGYFGTDV